MPLLPGCECTGSVASLAFQDTQFELPASDGQWTMVCMPVGAPLDSYAAQAGLSTDDVKSISQVYGLESNLLVVANPQFLDLFIEHALAPFFVFQVFSVGLWFLDEYWYYSLFTLGMLVLLEVTVVFQRLQQHKQLRAMRPAPAPAWVFRAGQWQQIPAQALLPGDVIAVAHDYEEEKRRKDAHAEAVRYQQACQAKVAAIRANSGQAGSGFQAMIAAVKEFQAARTRVQDAAKLLDAGVSLPADALLLRGSVVVNEAMLTGESIPQRKTAVQADRVPEQATIMPWQGAPCVDPSEQDEWLQEHARHVLYAGTSLLSVSDEQHAAVSDSQAHAGIARVPAAPTEGALAVVVRTGYQTSQGQLLRTIGHAAARVTVGNPEAYGFLAMLVVFAVAASGYVLHVTMGQPDRDMWKVGLHCVMIITSVIPPELPIELAMAVNASMGKLVQRSIFCTEPFRIPLAGRVDVTAFDKTGTLTSDALSVRGVLPLPAGKPTPEKPLRELQTLEQGLIRNHQLLAALAGCHSVVRVLDGQLVGDPLELSVLASLGWTVTARRGASGAMLTIARPAAGEQELAVLREAGGPHIQVPASALASSALSTGCYVECVRQWEFTSALKRMSAVVRLVRRGAEDQHFVVSKGAPEVIGQHCAQLPAGYTNAHTLLAAAGVRVIAYAVKRVPASGIGRMTRAEAESELEPVGLLALDTPLKSTTRTIVSQLRHSLHHVIMITGDAALTAAAVAKKCGMSAQGDPVRILDCQADGSLIWQRLVVGDDVPSAEDVQIEWEEWDEQWLTRAWSGGELVAVTGPAFAALQDAGLSDAAMAAMCGRAVVFARVSPAQKEAIIRYLNGAGHATLMCGDGTNDVGALKQATVGISILSAPKLEAAGDKLSEARAQQSASAAPAPAPAPAPGAGARSGQAQRVTALNEQLDKLQQELAMESAVVKLGDASMAAPFTSKSPSIAAAENIIRAGRTTLVTTHQMFKILGVNCLVASYQLSVLSLWGVKSSDTQSTVVGMSMAALFMSLSWAAPVERLTAQRPQSTVFTAPLLLSLFGQFFIHLVTLYAASMAAGPYFDSSIGLDGEFKANVVNSVMFLLLWVMQTSTFAVNYTGRPFLPDLREYKSMFYMVAGSYTFAFVAAADIMPDINEMLDLVQLAPDLQTWTITLMAANTAAVYALQYAIKMWAAPITAASSKITTVAKEQLWASGKPATSA